ncbi:TPA: sigma-54-dependent Fis family transcriptional regulator [Pseudomonas aeruginosa]|uniref:sigma-54-dependent transcriptional regulator n=1 Tax=Pseudomonas TaxID=286 RepID=UPI00053DA65B|nr:MULTISPECIES: sigma-54 dependent transcriptional regulator [Pseudomonas]KSS10004.1 sigma-54-dependent Fis family transcriptional regulator [Pseudomonas aeruginosa]MBG6712799.1 sigma-54-dependent Fis family transcriptional regulator [Pseudomonas aeruginosa]MBG7428360.1 sigma-54-dependent Fis family transcriptional regulator [Pseudomonas aeruginosa]MBG7464499.1 sigma-54-dependent Fis family transcriptional regulator [Pseudomonas aeruginosa]MBU5960194.1 sigma-54 dependent transcriptional regul
MARTRILIVDDEDSIRFGMRGFLESRGYGVVDADSCQRARELFQASPPDVAVIDYRLHDGSALDLLRDFRRLEPDVPVIVLTAYGSIDLAVQAIKEGAEQFLTKPIEMPALHAILKRLLDNRRLQRQQRIVVTREQRERIDPLFGESPAIRALAEQVDKVMGSDSPILILGETGTGKSLLAKWLHLHGPRADEPFVDLNCAGLSPDFLETELFGHEKGAFTGATASKPGILEIADGGTVFLDEIGDVDPRVQPKLLKVLEEQRFRRLGAVREREVDIRLIAATHQDLAGKVKERTFRSDLYFRISSIPLSMPALRERKEDIPALARTLLARLADAPGRSVRLGEDAEQALCGYAWPGNIRELRNVLERAVLLRNGDTIARRDLRFESTPLQDVQVGDTGLTLQQVERQHIERVLREVGGKVEQAALRLGIPRSTLYQKIKVHGIVAAQNDPG